MCCYRLCNLPLISGLESHMFMKCCWNQVHSVMCTELMKLVDMVDRLLPEIEAARPRCTSGLQPLCSLINAINKAKLLIQDCSESSKLYLVCVYWTFVKDLAFVLFSFIWLSLSYRVSVFEYDQALKGTTVLSRCKNTNKLLDQSLSQIQTMVPVMLVTKVSQFI